MKPYYQYANQEGQLKALAREIRAAVAEVEAATGQRPENVHFLAARRYVAIRDAVPLDPGATAPESKGPKVLAFAAR